MPDNQPAHEQEKHGTSTETYTQTGAMHNIPVPIPDASLPSIVIGILNYNRAQETLRTLKEFLAIDYPPDNYQLIVIDNASTDGSAEIIGNTFGNRVEIMPLPVNIGPVARNRVMLGRQEPYNFVFDEDCTPERPDTIRKVVEFMEANRYFGALCFRSFNSYAGITEYGNFPEFARRRLANGASEGMYVIGNGMCFRRDAIQRTSGYDERLFWGGEEYELSLELLYHDVPIAYHPDLTLIHRHAPRAITPARVYEVDMRNNIWISFKFFPVFLALPVATLHTIRRLGMAAVKRNGPRFKAILRGLREGLARLPEFYATRKPIPIRKFARHSRWFFQMFYSPKSFRNSVADARQKAATTQQNAAEGK